MRLCEDLRAKRGQNTAEYLIMLTLVVIGSITLWTAFGKTIHSKIAYVSAAISGDTTEYERSQKVAVNAAKAAIEGAKKEKNIKMEGIDKADLESAALSE